MLIWLGFSLFNLVLCIAMMYCYSKPSKSLGLSYSKPLGLRDLWTTLSITLLGPIGILVLIIAFVITLFNEIN